MSKKILRTIAFFLLGICIAVLLFVAVLLTAQYRPEDYETVSEKVETDYRLNIGDTVKIMTWNVGYGALGEDADFFMDGGTMVDTATKEEVYSNLQSMTDFITKESPDVLMLQESDRNSKRSHYIDEVEYIQENTTGYIHTFANNFKVMFVPYPVPPIGKVDCGISTFQKFPLNEAERIQLYCPFNWFVRAFNLKRCLMVNRIPIEGSYKELVIVNLHLEAYDTGVGKLEQTRQLREFIEKEYEKGNYCIAGGDFNQTFSNAERENEAFLKDAEWKPALLDVQEFNNFTAITDTTNPTCRSLQRILTGERVEDFPAYIIDGFLVSDNLEILSVETKNLKFKNTDHNPVVLQVKLK